MRQFFLACLFGCFIFFTANAQTANRSDLLKQLLDLPAPPVSETSPAEALKRVSRAPDFYDKDKVPPDDAPVEDLVEYWARQSREYRLLRYNVKPSEKTVERLLGFSEENPGQLSLFLNVLPTKPEVAEVVKRLYDKLSEKENPDYSDLQIRNWLVYHSIFFVEELVNKAEKVKDKNEYVANQADLLALARVEWNRAVPILERLTGDKTQPVSGVLARWAHYAHALEEGDEMDVSKYRRQLQDVVEDRNASAGARDLAFDALVSEKDWDGRDDWYLSLLADETLYELRVNGQIYTGLTTLLLYSPPEKYARAMANLVENKNPPIRRAAIKNLVLLMGGGNVDAVRALLPWLSNPNWQPDFPNERRQLIGVLGKVDLPESVPGLIDILMTEPEYRLPVAEALTRYKDPRAIPGLRNALAAEETPYARAILIRAMDECGGIDDSTKMSALEFYAAILSTPEGAAQFFNRGEVNENTLEAPPVTLNIGHYVAQMNEPPDGLAMLAVERLKALRKTKPAVANSLLSIMQRWKGRIIYAERLRQIREGEANLETILTALVQRGEIRKEAETEVFAMRAANGTGRGIAACLAEDETDAISVLRQKDADAQTAMFACARLLRLKLPVAETSAFMESQNKRLALAAERYLETEDSTEARTLVLARHEGEAVILGAREAFVPDAKNVIYNDLIRQIFADVAGRGYFGANFSGMDKTETALRDEIKSNPDLMAVYGFLPNTAAGQLVIRVFKDKVVFTDYEDEARYRERTLTAKEYEDFYRLLLEEKIDAAKPDFNYRGGVLPTEFVMFGKNGGRRVFFSDIFSTPERANKIFERFASFGKGNLKLQYRLGERIKGLEVLLAEDDFEARAVWKNGIDLRVLVEDKAREAEIHESLEAEFEAENKVEIEEDNYQEIEKRRATQQNRRAENKYAHFFWRSFENGGLGAISTQPPDAPFLFDETQFPETVDFDSNPRAWQVRAGNYEIRVSNDETGLYKVSRAAPPVKVRDGRYDLPVVTGDGNWVIAAKPGANYGAVQSLARINLKTGKEFPVALPPADTFKAIAFIASQNKILITRARGNRYANFRPNQSDDDEEAPVVQANKDDKSPSPATPEYYLLDAATGAVQMVKGEFRPLEEQTYRPLQASTAPNEFWAAVYDKKAKETAIGRYNTNTFAFQTVLKLPEIKLGSMDIWVDEAQAKVYFVYEGHLLAAPLPKG
ncbi:MAG TPA: HEAT repeat domain-containing protein [Pyrinomonadaceae bacterium]|jgi:hypothetical protein